MDIEQVKTTLRKASPLAIIAAAIVATAIVAYAGASVYHLFSTYIGLTLFESMFATLASVGALVALLFVVVTTDNQNTRGLGAIWMIAYSLATLTLVAFDSVMRSPLLIAPDSIVVIGQIVAGILPAVSFAMVASMVVAMRDRSETRSAAGAASKYVGFAGKSVALGASSFAAFYFGQSRGIDPVVSVLCAALLESSFLWSYLSLKNSRDRGDRFDIRMWSVCVLAFGAFIVLVSIETISTLGHIEVPIVAALGHIGAMFYVCAVGLSMALTVLVHLLTRAIDDIPAQAAVGADDSPWSVKAANRIRGARAGAGEIGAALRGQPAPAPADRQLTAGAAMAKDAPVDPDENMRAFTQELVAELRAEQARKANHNKADAELVGVVKPGDTKVSALNNGHTKTKLPDDVTAGVRAAAAERKAKRAGGGASPDTKSGGAE